MGILNRIQHGWNAFMNKDPTSYTHQYSSSYYRRPDRVRLTGGNERSIVNSILTRMAVDAAAIDIRHVRLDDLGRYKEDLVSSINDRLTIEANVDQTGRAFLQDAYASMFDEGCVALVPIDTTVSPRATGSYSIDSIRTGKIEEWKPRHVRVYVYNDRTGKKESIWVPKSMVAIVENPFYSIMNERNSVMQRLSRKLALLDAVDELSSSGKLDMIIQLPYVIKSEARMKQAEDRRAAIEKQLTNSQLGIAYIDGTERVTQLNRPLENNLLKQVEYLTSMLFSQLGMTQAIMDGTADESTMNNYYTRILEPPVAAVVDEMKRKFLTKTARSQKQSIMYFRDPFGLVPVNQLAELADKFTRNEIMTSNEIRQIIGMKPINDPKADQLINSNLNQSPELIEPMPGEEEVIDEYDKEGEIQNE